MAINEKNRGMWQHCVSALLTSRLGCSDSLCPSSPRGIGRGQLVNVSPLKKGAIYLHRFYLSVIKYHTFIGMSSDNSNSHSNLNMCYFN